MKRLLIGAAMLALLASPAATARPDNHHNDRGHSARKHAPPQRDGRWHEQSGKRDNGRHLGWGRNRGTNHHWGRGQQMGYNDWHNARRVDWRRNHLRQPPRGYEWRRTDDRFVMAAVTTGVILSVILITGR